MTLSDTLILVGTEEADGKPSNNPSERSQTSRQVAQVTAPDEELDREEKAAAKRVSVRDAEDGVDAGKVTIRYQFLQTAELKRFLGQQVVAWEAIHILCAIKFLALCRGRCRD